MESPISYDLYIESDIRYAVDDKTSRWLTHLAFCHFIIDFRLILTVDVMSVSVCFGSNKTPAGGCLEVAAYWQSARAVICSKIAFDYLVVKISKYFNNIR